MNRVYVFGEQYADQDSHLHAIERLRLKLVAADLKRAKRDAMYRKVFGLVGALVVSMLMWTALIYAVLYVKGWR